MEKNLLSNKRYIEHMETPGFQKIKRDDNNNAINISINSLDEENILSSENIIINKQNINKVKEDINYDEDFSYELSKDSKDNAIESGDDEELPFSED